MISPPHGTSLRGFSLLNIHTEWLFEWTMEILASPLLINLWYSRKELNRTMPVGAELFGKGGPKPGEFR